MASSKPESDDHQEPKEDRPQTDLGFTEKHEKEIEDLNSRPFKKVTSIHKGHSPLHVVEIQHDADLQHLLESHSELLQTKQSSFEKETFTSKIGKEELKKKVWTFLPKGERGFTEKEKEKINGLISKCHDKVTKISKALARVDENTPYAEIEELLRPHIDCKHLEAIKSEFDRETFIIEFKWEQQNEVYEVECRRGDKSFLPTICIRSNADLKETTAQQIGGLVVEVFFLLLSVAGIHLPLNEDQIEKAMKNVIELVKKTEFENLVTEFVDNLSSTSVWKRAKAIWDFILGWYNMDILNTIIEIFFTDMSWWDTSIAVAEIVALIVVNMATGGIVMIAQFVLAALNLKKMAHKVDNMMKLRSPENFDLQ